LPFLSGKTLDGYGVTGKFGLRFINKAAFELIGTSSMLINLYRFERNVTKEIFKPGLFFFDRFDFFLG
jgi:hypothetical protein